MTTEDETTVNEAEVPFSARLAEHRARIATRIRTSLNGSGVVMFDGEVMSEDEARDRYRALARRQRVLLVELAGLFALLGVAAFFVWRVLIGFAG